MEAIMSNNSENREGFVVDLFRHNAWANLKLLNACEGLSEGHLAANVPGTYGTIRDTLLHIVGAEVSYVRRVNGRLPDNPPKRGEFPGFEVLKKAVTWCEEEYLQLALNATPADMVVETWEGKTARYRLTALLTQAINHSTEHRAQIATILTQQGIEPPDMSGWMYMDEMGIFQETEDVTGN
jgi:uncharacterized damage-inducible protein DinB